jgi:hypothetical protein
MASVITNIKGWYKTPFEPIPYKNEIFLINLSISVAFEKEDNIESCLN